MKSGKVEIYINEQLESKGALLFSLIDPVDYRDEKSAVKTAKDSVRGGADVVLIGGSVGVQGSMLDSVAKSIKEEIDVPLVLFPNNNSTITTYADAIYFISLLNSRNPYFHTQAQLLAAPVLRAANIEPLPMGYILISPGGTAAWISDANLVPREKPTIAALLALTGEYFGFRFILTDTGSSPQSQGEGPIPPEMIRAVKSMISVPYIVAGGIRTVKDLRAAYSSGADIVQVGTAFQSGRGDATYRAASSLSKVAKEEGLKKIKKL